MAIIKVISFFSVFFLCSFTQREYMQDRLDYCRCIISDIREFNIDPEEGLEELDNELWSLKFHFSFFFEHKDKELMIKPEMTHKIKGGL